MAICGPVYRPCSRWVAPNGFKELHLGHLHPLSTSLLKKSIAPGGANCDDHFGPKWGQMELSFLLANPTPSAGHQRPRSLPRAASGSWGSPLASSAKPSNVISAPELIYSGGAAQLEAAVLMKKYGIRGIPALIIVSPDGKTITKNGRGDVSSNAKGAIKAWAKKSS